MNSPDRRVAHALLVLTLLSVLACGCSDRRGRPFIPDQTIPPPPVIDSIYVSGSPIRPFYSWGDLWMNTWADDGNLYTAWGDGGGVEEDGTYTDCGIACLKGTLPLIEAGERCRDAPTPEPGVNDKPSSLLFLDGRLCGHFHSPLGDPWIGYLAYSDDYGRTWTRIGFYRDGTSPPPGASPWTRDRLSRFRCMFFINMGQNYELNQDGFVYGLGIGREWSWYGGVRLARVPRHEILQYESYEYLSGFEKNEPLWSSLQLDAIALPNLSTWDQGSAMYHPGIERYLFLTSCDLYEAPTPWGPWTSAGSWVATAGEEWQGGYQPGIISKGTEPDAFWFTIAGQNELPRLTYRLNLGRIVMRTGADSLAR